MSDKPKKLKPKHQLSLHESYAVEKRFGLNVYELDELITITHWFFTLKDNNNPDAPRIHTRIRALATKAHENLNPKNPR